jgi:hypothetical protein
MPQRLSLDALIERAQRETGLRDFDRETFRDGLSILVSEANSCAGLPEAGRAGFADNLVKSLSDRLRVTEYVRTHPEVLKERIERPVIVLGAPRTGTTLTSNLLATDPSRRSLLSWIFEDPVPPPELDELTTDPRCLKVLDRERALREQDPSAGRFYRASAVYPTECIWAMHHDFKTLAWEASFPMPVYADFILNADMSTAYDYHRLFLQMLQSRAKGAWNLKMPSHSLHIRWMIKAYPDARIVWTHRDPFTAMGSLMSLIASSQARLMGEADNAWIAKNYPPQIAAHVDRVLAFKAERPDVPIHDLRYADMMRDPIAEMRRLYAFLGDDFTPEVEAGMRAWLDENPQGKYGKHAYSLDKFGHTEASIRPYFENYLSKVDVEREGL